jgi:hypothetical protein
MRRAGLCGVAVVVLGLCLLVTWWLSPWAPGLPGAQAQSTGHTGGQKIAFLEDVTVGPGDSWENVVVVGGNLVIEGSVTNTAVVVGGNLTVRSEGSVGSGSYANPDHDAVVCVFGELTIEPGAAVSGNTVTVASGASDNFHKLAVDPVVRPWTLISVIGWIGSTVFIALVAVILAAVAPRQLTAVGRRAQRHALSSLGWGILFLFIGVPLVSVLLAVTGIGLIVALPGFFIGVPVALLFGYVSVGALVGRLVLTDDRQQRGRVMLAAAVGVLVLSVLRWIPFAGSFVVLLGLLIGFGALFTAVWEWRRSRRSAAQTPGPPSGVPPYERPGYDGTGQSGGQYGPVGGGSTGSSAG